MSQTGFDMFLNCGEYDSAAAIFSGASPLTHHQFREVHDNG